jgi:hypothetical protein
MYFNDDRCSSDVKVAYKKGALLIAIFIVRCIQSILLTLNFALLSLFCNLQCFIDYDYTFTIAFSSWEADALCTTQTSVAI